MHVKLDMKKDIELSNKPNDFDNLLRYFSESLTSFKL